MTERLEKRVFTRVQARHKAHLLAAQFRSDPALAAIFDDMAHRFDSALEAAQAELRVAEALRNATRDGDA